MTDGAHETNGQSAPPLSGDEAEVELARLVSKAIEIVLYAPIGVLLDGPALLPKLAEQGKVHVKNAEWLGGMALKRGRAALGRRLETAGAQAADFLRMMGVVADDAPPFASRDRSPARTRPATRSVTEPDSAETSSPPVDALAIPDYDSLSASQVVNRLPSLSPDELEAVRAYEAAHRGRKTILNKVVQLQA